MTSQNAAHFIDAEPFKVVFFRNNDIYFVADAQFDGRERVITQSIRWTNHADKAAKFGKPFAEQIAFAVDGKLVGVLR